MMYTFKVPAGIGDFSWVYSKLVNFGQPFRLIVCGDQPRRTLPFAEILPAIKSAEYGPFSYWPIFETMKLGLPENTDMKSLEPGEYYIAANTWLEHANKLADFLPSLRTTYHYKFKNLSPYCKADFWKHDFSGKRLIGVYTSKYANYCNDFKFWSEQEWVDFLTQLKNVVGECVFFFIGASFDNNDLGNVIAKRIQEFAQTVNLIGQTHIGEVVALLKTLDYLVSFPSGIGVLGDVVNIPTMHFIPKARESLRNLVNTYADPVNVRSGKHINQLFCTPEEAIQKFIEKGARFVC